MSGFTFVTENVEIFISDLRNPQTLTSVCQPMNIPYFFWTLSESEILLFHECLEVRVIKADHRGGQESPGQPTKHFPSQKRYRKENDVFFENCEKKTTNEFNCMNFRGRKFIEIKFVSRFLKNHNVSKNNSRYLYNKVSTWNNPNFGFFYYISYFISIMFKIQ